MRLLQVWVKSNKSGDELTTQCCAIQIVAFQWRVPVFNTLFLRSL